MSSQVEVPGIVEAVVLAGSQTALASAIGVSPQAVQRWVSDGYAPNARCHKISAIYGIPISRLINPVLCDRVSRKR